MTAYPPFLADDLEPPGPADARYHLIPAPLEASVRELLRRHGQEEFDPYLFDDRLLDDMIELFSRLPDPASTPDQSYRDAPAASPAPGFWSRLKQRLFG